MLFVTTLFFNSLSVAAESNGIHKEEEGAQEAKVSCQFTQSLHSMLRIVSIQE